MIKSTTTDVSGNYVRVPRGVTAGYDDTVPIGTGTGVDSTAEKNMGNGRRAETRNGVNGRVSSKGRRVSWKYRTEPTVDEELNMRN